MRRIFIDGKIGESVTVTGSDAHHLGYSLRARIGDRYIIADKDGAAALMEIAAFRENEVDFRLICFTDDATESPIEIVLAACLTKGDKFDWVVQKATELGAAAIQPLVSANTVVKCDEKRGGQKRARWQRIAAEAAKQCGRNRIPAVAPLADFCQFIAAGIPSDTAAFIAYEKANAIGLGDFLRNPAAFKNTLLYQNAEIFAFRKHPPKLAKRVSTPLKGGSLGEWQNSTNVGITANSILPNDSPAVAAENNLSSKKESPPPIHRYIALVGAEGGFTPDEARAAEAAGFVPVSLGPRILRAETAALAALAIVQYAAGDLGGISF